MKSNAKVNLIISSALLLSFMLCSCAPDLSGVDLSGTEETTETTAQIKTDYLPGQDFYGYVNAEYLASLEYDTKYGGAGSFIDVQKIVNEQTDELIRNIVNGDGKSYVAGSNEDLIYRLYWQYYNASAEGGSIMTADEYDGFMKEVNSIYEANSINELIDVVYKVSENYSGGIFLYNSVQPGLSNPDYYAPIVYEYTIGDIESASKGGEEAVNFKDEINNSLVGIGIESSEAEKRAFDAAYVYIDIAKHTKKIADIETAYSEAVCYKKSEIDSMLPNLKSEGLLKIMGISPNANTDIYLVQTEQMKFIDEKMTDDNLQVWKDVFVQSIYKMNSSYFPKDKGGNEFVSNPDEMALGNVKSNLSKEVSEVYAAKYSDEAKVTYITNMINDIREQYKVLINNSDYSNEAKKVMIKKLDNLSINVGADKPHEIKPSDKNLIGETVYQTITNLNKKSASDYANKVGSKSSKNGFEDLTSNTVNACYIPYYNSITIPLAIMNEPFFSLDYSYEKNLGGIGSVIAHEISHGFDDFGILYDENGAYNPSRIPDSDQQIFISLQDKTITYYDSFKVTIYFSVDGELTLGENLADISGVQCILSLVNSKEQKKEVLEQYARVFATLMSIADVTSNLEMDSHSPEKVRVNAVVKCMDDFYEIYEIKEDDNMYLKKEDRINRW